MGSEEGRYCQGSHATEVKGQHLPTFLVWLEVPLQKWVEIEEKQLQKNNKQIKQDFYELLLNYVPPLKLRSPRYKLLQEIYIHIRDIHVYMWQSQIEIEYYSVASFKRFTKFDMLCTCE